MKFFVMRYIEFPLRNPWFFIFSICSPVFVYHNGEEGTLWLERFEIVFHPVCSLAAQVGGDGSAAFTDRVERPGAYAAVNHAVAERADISIATPQVPWGAIQAFNKATLAVDSSEVAREGDWNQTDAIYTDWDNLASREGLHHIFARALEIWGVDSVFSEINAAGNLELFNSTSDREMRQGDYAIAEPNYLSYLMIGDVWNVTESAAGDDPQIRAVGECELLSNECEELGLRAPTVNGETFGDVRGTRQVRANMQFFAFADANQMPLREITVDWGDGTAPVPRTGSFKNHRGQGECNGSDFGRMERACEERPVTVQHDYRCSSGLLETLPLCGGSGRPNHVSGYANGGGGGCREGNSCVYVPRVHVRDNWGWCAGSCPGNPGGPPSRCYDGYGNPFASRQFNECNTEYPNSEEENKDPWIYFEGRIVVEAEQRE